MKILITGGAGYLGCVLTEQLLHQGHSIVCFDNLSFGHSFVNKFTLNDKFRLVIGDITNKEDLSSVINSCDIIIHLAGIVGYPQCSKEPDLAQKVNIDGSKFIIELAKKSIPVIFCSTGSVYGNAASVCYENSTANPLTLYSQHKLEGEKLFLERGNTVIFRLATVYGISSKMRSDLLINNFVKEAVTKKYLEVYEKEYARTFINVRDAAGAFVFTLCNLDKMNSEIYNIGSNDLNYSKEEICNMIKRKTQATIIYNEFDKDQDQRNYIVNYDKISKAGYQIKNTLDQDLEDLIKYYYV